MKFRNPETGFEYLTFKLIYGLFCSSMTNCKQCPLKRRKSPWGCLEYWTQNQGEAATLMGFEVIGDDVLDTNVGKKEDNMEKKEKHWLLAEDGDGIVCSECGTDFCVLINEVERFNYCPNCGVKLAAPIEPRLTEDELAICKLTGANYVTRDKNNDRYVLLWAEKPDQKTEDGRYLPKVGTVGAPYCEMWVDCFPSVKPGDCICVEEVQHG